MSNRQKPLQNGQAGIVSGTLGFDDIACNAAPFVGQHRMRVGRPGPLPCFVGQFGNYDIGEGQTVHQCKIDPETEFETSFVAKPGLLVTIVLDGHLEFSLDGVEYSITAHGMPVAVAWVNQDPVQVVRRTRLNDPLVKVQVRTPLAAFDTSWQSLFPDFINSHCKVVQWRPGLAVTEAASQLIEADGLSKLRSRMASSRFSIEALDALLEHLESMTSIHVDARLSAARAFVEQTALDRPSLADIAAATGFSVSALQRAYRNAYSMTVIEHQRKLLLEQAMEGLRQGNLSVSEAAARSGYGNASNFSAAFAKVFGVTPSEVKHAIPSN